MIRGTASALRFLLLTSVPSLICLCKPFSCKSCPRNDFSQSNDRLSSVLLRDRLLPLPPQLHSRLHQQCRHHLRRQLHRRPFHLHVRCLQAPQFPCSQSRRRCPPPWHQNPSSSPPSPQAASTSLQWLKKIDVQRRFKNCLPTTTRTSRSSRPKRSLLSELLRQLLRACESSKLVQDHRSPAHQRRRGLLAGRQATRTSRSAHSLRPILYRFRSRHLHRSRSDQQHRRSSRSLTSMRLQEAFYPHRFRLICRNSTSEHEITSGTWRWRARDRDHQERRDQDPGHQVHPDHGACD